MLMYKHFSSLFLQNIRFNIFQAKTTTPYQKLNPKTLVYYNFLTLTFKKRKNVIQLNLILICQTKV
jgi:hypothetical protein